jgi:hypothetical protein
VKRLLQLPLAATGSAISAVVAVATAVAVVVVLLVIAAAVAVVAVEALRAAHRRRKAARNAGDALCQRHFGLSQSHALDDGVVVEDGEFAERTKVAVPVEPRVQTL